MKLSLIATILVAPVLVQAISPVYAEETLERYTYNGDGTYAKSGSEVQNPNESVGSNSSASNIEASVGYAKSYDFDTNQMNWNLRGSHASRFSNGLNVQVDANYQLQDSDYADASEYNGAIHVAYHKPDDYAFGVFGQIGLVDLDGLSENVTDSNFGVEAAAFLEDATVYGRVGYHNISIYGFDTGSAFFQGGVRYFVNDNMRLDFDAKFDDTFTQLTAAGNYRIDGTPMSMFAGYTYENMDTEFFGSYDSGMVFAGLRLHFNSESLRDEERNGLIWSTIN